MGSRSYLHVWQFQIIHGWKIDKCEQMLKEFFRCEYYYLWQDIESGSSRKGSTCPLERKLLFDPKWEKKGNWGIGKSLDFQDREKAVTSYTCCKDSSSPSIGSWSSCDSNSSSFPCVWKSSLSFFSSFHLSFRPFFLHSFFLISRLQSVCVSPVLSWTSVVQRHNIDSLWDKKSHLPAVESDTLEYLKLQLLWLLRLTRDEASFSSLFSFTLECTLWMSQSRVLVSIGEWLTYMQPPKICTVSPYTQNIGIRGALWLKW